MKVIFHRLPRLFLCMAVYLTYSCGKSGEGTRIYYPNGSLREKTEYTDREKDRYIMYEYYETGRLKSVSEKQSGRMDGVSKIYGENGKLKTEANWKNDSMNGETRYYLPNGKLDEAIHWKDNLLHGKGEHYYEDGKLKDVSFYRNGRRNGFFVSYTQAGKVSTKTLFAGDTLVYSAFYNRDGSFGLGGASPITFPEKDTILLGETYRVTIRFMFPIRGDLRLYTGKLNGDNQMVKKTGELTRNADNSFMYSETARKTGLNTIPFLVVHKSVPGDTLSPGGIVLKHSYHVK